MIAFPEGEGKHVGVDLTLHVAPMALTSPVNYSYNHVVVVYDMAIVGCKQARLRWSDSRPACMGELRVSIPASECFRPWGRHASLLVSGSVWGEIDQNFECRQ